MMKDNREGISDPIYLHTWLVSTTTLFFRVNMGATVPQVLLETKPSPRWIGLLFLTSAFLDRDFSRLLHRNQHMLP